MNDSNQPTNQRIKQASSVLVNQDNWVAIDDKKTKLSESLIKLQCNDDGVAVAINNQVVTKDQWSVQILNHNDKISIFGAIAGG